MSDVPYYDYEGKQYTRISTVLDYFKDPGIIKWQLKLGPEESKLITKEALKVGTRVDWLIKDNEPKDGIVYCAKKDGIEVKNCIEGWNLFRKEHPEVKILAFEKFVHSPNHLIAGTLDVETEDSILDIKCAGRISAKYWLQVAMYNFMNPVRRKNLAILRLHKSLGTYEYQTIPYQENLVMIFLGLLEALRFYKIYESGDSDDSDLDFDSPNNKITKKSQVAGSEVSDDRTRGHW